MNVFELFGTISLDDANYRRSLTNAERDTDAAGTRMGGSFTRFGAVAAAGTVAAGAAVTAMVGKGIAEFATLEAGMNEVFSLMPSMTETAMQDMTDDVQAFASEMGVVTDDVVPALYNSISAGVPAENVFSFLETANMLAVGGVSDLNTAVDGLTSATNAYGVEILGAQEASDIMFTAVKAGKTTIDEIASSIGNIAPLAASVNVGFDEVNASIATLTSQGIGTSEAVTGLKAALSNILKPAGDMRTAMMNIATELVNNNELSGPLVDQYRALQERSAALQEQMIGLSDSSPEFDQLNKDLEDVIQSMEDTAASMGPAIIESQGLAGTLELITQQADGGRDGLAAMFGSVEGLNSVLALTSEEGGAAYIDTLTEMQDASGATQAAFEQMDQGIARNFERLKAQLQVFMTELGERFGPLVESVLVSAVAFFETFSTQALAFIDNVVQFWQGGFGSIADATGVQTSEILAYWESFKTLLTALFTALVALWENVLQPAWESIQPLVKSVLDAVGPLFRGLVETVTLAFEGLAALLTGDFTGAFESFSNAAQTYIRTMVDAAITILGGLISTLSGYGAWIKDTFAGVIEAAFESIGNAFGSLRDSSVEAFRDLFNSVGALARSGLEQVQGAFEWLNGALQNSWTALVGVLGSLASSLAAGVQAAFGNAVDWLIERMNDAIESINGIIERINRALEIELPDIAFTIPNPLPGRRGFDINVNIPDINPPDIPNIPALAKGGVVDQATLALIGEAGPEVVVPLDQYDAMRGLAMQSQGVPGGLMSAGMASVLESYTEAMREHAFWLSQMAREGMRVTVGTQTGTSAGVGLPRYI